jgi:hypothetical protein
MTLGKPMVDFEMHFPHNYEIEQFPELPGGGSGDVPLFCFPRPGGSPERDGLWIEVRPQGYSSWHAVFANGHKSPPAISKVISTPDPFRACVDSKGSGYVVKATDPDDWQTIPIFPIVDIHLLPQHECLLFIDFSMIAAYGRNGMMWQAKSPFDGLKITNADGNRIEGVGYYPASASDCPFVVDARSGDFKIVSTSR